jgi:hypothetical protein
MGDMGRYVVRMEGDEFRQGFVKKVRKKEIIRNSKCRRKE